MGNISASTRLTATARVVLLALVAFVLATVASISSAAPAAAHAEWLGSSPEVDATVDVLPAALTLTFSSDLLDAEGATEIVVTDEAGTSVTVGTPTVDGAVVTQQLADEASAGLYNVIWKVVYADGHADSKEFSFTVSTSTLPSSSPSPEPTATSNESATTQPEASSTPVTTTEEPGTDVGMTIAWVLLIILAIALIALVSVITIRKRRSANGPDVTDSSAR